MSLTLTIRGNEGEEVAISTSEVYAAGLIQRWAMCGSIGTGREIISTGGGRCLNIPYAEIREITVSRTPV